MSRSPCLHRRPIPTCAVAVMPLQTIEGDTGKNHCADCAQPRLERTAPDMSFRRSIFVSLRQVHQRASFSHNTSDCELYAMREIDSRNRLRETEFFPRFSHLGLAPPLYEMVRGRKFGARQTSFRSVGPDRCLSLWLQNPALSSPPRGNHARSILAGKGGRPIRNDSPPPLETCHLRA